MSTTITLTLGISNDSPISNYGYSFYNEATTGFPGAPFGAVSGQLRGCDIIYLAWGADPISGFNFYLYLANGLLAAPPSLIDRVDFEDDTGKVWTFYRADADNPEGSDFSFGDGDVRAWEWHVEDSLPTVTPASDYDFIFADTTVGSIESSGTDGGLAIENG